MRMILLTGNQAAAHQLNNAYGWLQARMNAQSVLTGLAIAFGLSQAWYVADVLLLFAAIPYRKPPLALALVALPVAVVSLWTHDTLAGFLAPSLFAFRIVALYSAVTQLRHPGATLSVAAAWLTAQAAVASLTFMDARPHGFTLNAQQLAITHFAILNAFPSLSMLGIALSGARFPMFLIWFYAWLSNYPNINKRLIAYAFIATSIFVFGLWSQGELRRLDVGVIKANGETRTHLAIADDPVTDAITIYKPSAVSDNPHRGWNWYGYGFNNYNVATGLDTPHNTFISLFFELGIFSLFVFVGMWLMMRRMTLPAFLTAALYLGFVDDFYLYPYGTYAAALFVIPLWMRHVARSSQRDNVPAHTESV